MIEIRARTFLFLFFWTDLVTYFLADAKMCLYFCYAQHAQWDRIMHKRCTKGEKKKIIYEFFLPAFSTSI